MSDEYQVETILSHTTYEDAFNNRKTMGFNPDDKTHYSHSMYVYLVKWEGYEEMTWEPESNLEDNIELTKYKQRVEMVDDHIKFDEYFNWDRCTTPIAEPELPLPSSMLIHNALSGRKNKDRRRSKRRIEDYNDIVIETKKKVTKKVIIDTESSDEESTVNLPKRTTRSTTGKNETFMSLDLSSSNNSDFERSEGRKKGNDKKKKKNSSKKRHLNMSETEEDIVDVNDAVESCSTSEQPEQKKSYTISVPKDKDGKQLVFIFKRNSDDTVSEMEDMGIHRVKEKSKEEGTYKQKGKHKGVKDKERNKHGEEEKEFEERPEKKRRVVNEVNQKNMAHVSIDDDKKGKQKFLSNKKQDMDKSSRESLPPKTVSGDLTTPRRNKKTQFDIDIIDKDYFRRSKSECYPEKANPRRAKLLDYHEVPRDARASTASSTSKTTERLTSKLKAVNERLKTAENEKSVKPSEKKIPVYRYGLDTKRNDFLGRHLLKSRRWRSAERLNDRWDKHSEQYKRNSAVEDCAFRVSHLINCTNALDGGPNSMSVFLRASKKSNKFKTSDDDMKALLKTHSLPTTVISKSSATEIVNIGEDSPKTSKEDSPKTSKEASSKTSKKASSKTSKEASHKTSKEASSKTSKEASHKTSKEASHKTSKEASPKTSKEASPKTSKEASPKTSKEASPKTSKEASTKTSKENSSKTSKEASASLPNLPSLPVATPSPLISQFEPLLPLPPPPPLPTLSPVPLPRSLPTLKKRELKYVRSKDCPVQNGMIINLKTDDIQREKALDVICAYCCCKPDDVERGLASIPSNEVRFQTIKLACTQGAMSPLLPSPYVMKNLESLYSADLRDPNTVPSLCSPNHMKCRMMRIFMDYLTPKDRFVHEDSPFYYLNFLKCMKAGAHCQKLVFLLGGVPFGCSYDNSILGNDTYIDHVHISLLQQHPLFLIDFLKMGFDINAYGFKLLQPKPMQVTPRESVPLPMIQFFSECEFIQIRDTRNLFLSYLNNLRSVVIPYATRLEYFCRDQTKAFYSNRGAIINYIGPLTPAHVFRSIPVGDIYILSSLTGRHVNYVKSELQFPENIVSLSMLPKHALIREQCIVLLAINHINVVGGSVTADKTFNHLCIAKRNNCTNIITYASITFQNTMKEIVLEKLHYADSLTIFRFPKEHQDSLALDMIQITISVSGAPNRVFAAQLQLVEVP